MRVKKWIIKKNYSDYMPPRLFGLHLEASLREIDNRLDEIKTIYKLNPNIPQHLKDDITIRMIELCKTRSRIAQTLESIEL
jgi:hypothetical protein